MKIRKTTKSYETIDMTPDEYANAVVEYIGPKVIAIITDEESIDRIGLELESNTEEAELDEAVALFIDKLAAWLKNKLSAMYSCQAVQFERIVEKPEQ